MNTNIISADVNIIAMILGAVLFIVLAPVLGCLLAGIDRIISAKMQGRVGPPLLQPYYDMRKLFAKADASTNPTEHIYVLMYFIFVVLAGVVFCAGGNFLLVIFIITLGELFFIIAAYSARSPYADAGASREILQVMAYEPMVLLVAVGFYMVAGSFNVADIAGLAVPAVAYTPFLFIGFLFVLTIKLRKSPFDLSMSHHAHQELVRGMTTEMSGRTLAIIEISHWYESILFMLWVGLFFMSASWISIIVALIVVIVVYFLEILIDNNFARVKWPVVLKSSWWLAFILGAINLAILPVVYYLF